MTTLSGKYKTCAYKIIEVLINAGFTYEEAEFTLHFAEEKLKRVSFTHGFTYESGYEPIPPKVTEEVSEGEKIFKKTHFWQSRQHE